MEEWLTETAEACLRIVTATLYRGRLSPAQAADLAEDAVSFAHAQALKNLPALESARHCRNWVVRVVLNHAYEVQRTEGRRRERLQELALAEEERTPPLQPFVALMLELLPELSPEDRALIERRFLDGLTLQELADEIGLVTPSGASLRLSAAAPAAGTRGGTRRRARRLGGGRYLLSRARETELANGGEIARARQRSR
jgi:RNA polymerase sigma factor (sigma-70 family)